MGRSITNGPNLRLPQQKEADPQELLAADPCHILPKSQVATSLFLQDLSGVSPNCFHSCLTSPQNKGNDEIGRKEFSGLTCRVHQPPSVFLLLTNSSRKVTYSWMRKILLNFYSPSNKDFGKASP